MYYLKPKCITNVLEMYYKSECLQRLCISVTEKPNYWGGIVLKLTSVFFL